MAQPFIEHNGGERINALRIVAPQATQGTSLEEDICPHSGPVVYGISLYVKNRKQLAVIDCFLLRL
jgi:hypothetical protein